jgi:protein tyrosine/serine phosphatase
MATLQSTIEDPDIALMMQTSISEKLPEDAVKKVLSSPPFIPVPMALNMRTISSNTLAPNIIYRSGFLSHLPASSLSLLKSRHNIATIFDLRSRNERVRQPSPEVEEIETIWLPSIIDGESGVTGANSVEDKKSLLLDVKPADFIPNDGVPGYIKMYGNILQTHKDAYRAVFQKLRDGEGSILFHCTAGKDRTGVLAALIHALIDSPEEVIALDYGITRIGAEPFRERLLKALLQQMGRISDDMGPEQLQYEPGLEEMCGVRALTILAFLKSMNGKYGATGEVMGGYGAYSGAKGYLIQELGLNIDDLEKIKRNLTPNTN